MDQDIAPFENCYPKLPTVEIPQCDSIYCGGFRIRLRAGSDQPSIPSILAILAILVSRKSHASELVAAIANGTIPQHELSTYDADRRTTKGTPKN